ncbi:hypothetical protein JCM10213_008024 [Rhodosporidiobolus nylandii]
MRRRRSLFPFRSLLERKVKAIGGSLRALKGAGFRWPPLVRLALFKTFSLSHLDFGGDLLALALSADPSLSSSPAFSSLTALHSEAVAWISGVTHANRAFLASSLCGIPPPSLRLSHLSLGLALHLDRAPSLNPAASLYRRYRTEFLHSTDLPRSLPAFAPLLLRLALLPLHRDFTAACQEAADANLPIPSRQSFLRQSSIEYFDSRPSLLHSYILPSSRPNGLVDGVFRIRGQQDRRRAIQWRGCTFAHHLECVGCGRRFSRGCASHMWAAVGGFDEDGVVPPERLEDITARMQQLKQERQQRGQRSGTFDAVDFLLGHKRPDWAEIGFVTLRLQAPAHLVALPPSCPPPPFAALFTQDFDGQDLVERRIRNVLWAAAAIAFLLGFVLQDLRVTMGVFVAGYLSCLAIAVPPLSAYNANPVKWLAPLDEYGEPAPETTKTDGHAGAIEAKKER